MSVRENRMKPLRHLAVLVLVAAAYFVSAKLGLQAAVVAEQVTVVWPPTGIALAAILILGRRVWPAIAAGAFLANITSHEPLFTAAGIGAGNTLEAIVGAALLERMRFRWSMSRLRDVFGVAFFSCTVSTTVSATIGVSSLVLAGLQPWSRFGALWWNWWLGDATGALLVAPALLTWASRDRRVRAPGTRIEGALLALLVPLVAVIVFAGAVPALTTTHPLEYTIFPLVIWAAIRFGPRGASLVAAAVSTISVLGTLGGFGPFAVAHSVHESLVLLQLFMSIVAGTGLVLAAATMERRSAERHRATGYAVAEIFDAAASVPEALSRALGTIAQDLGWQLGRYWSVNAGGQLRCEHVWRAHAESPAPAGDDLPGPALAERVRTRGEAQWVRDLLDEPDLQAGSGARGAWRGAVGFPVRRARDVVAVFELASTRVRPRDMDAMSLLGALSAQIGLFIQRREIEASLRENHAALTAVVEGTPDSVFIKDREGRYRLINEAGARFLGKAPSEVLGKTDAELVDPDGGRQILERDRHIVETGEPHTYEQTITAAGVTRTFLVTKGPYRDGEGRVIGILGMSRDITERKAAEEERARQLEREQRLRLVAEAAERREAVLAEASRILAASHDGADALERVARLTVETVADCCTIGLAAEEERRPLVVACGDPARERIVRDVENLAPLETDPLYRLGGLPETDSCLYARIRGGDLQDIARDPEHRRLLAALGPVSALIVPIGAHGRVLGAMTLTSTRADRAYSEADLAFAHNLAQRIGLACESSRLYREASDASRMKDQFLAMLAHELRNPLAPVRNALEIVKREPERMEWARQIMTRQVEHMGRLVDDLIEVARVTTGRIELDPKPVDFGEVVRHVVDANRHLVVSRSQVLQVVVPDDPVVVRGDAARMEQIVVNLFQNAVKYTNAGGRIEIRLAVEESAAVLTVRDNGIGIAASLLPKLFHPFTQADRSLDRSEGGLGLGLALVRRLVEMHGGTVHASSAGPGCGSEFVVELPLAAGAAGLDVPEPRAACVAPPAQKVLVVEDNADSAESLALMLELSGHTVRIAGDGPSALEAVERFDPSVVVLDIGLPGIDGFEVARRLRAGGRTMTLIALTGYGQADDRRRSAEAGFDHHLVKPVDPAVLEELLASAGSESRRGAR